MALCTISDAARRSGVSPDTLRYYERLGLVRPEGRSAAGYRLYDSTTVGRVRFIKGAQRMGLRLDHIGELLEVRDRGDCPCGHARRLIRQRLGDIDRQVDQLRELRGQLAVMLTGLQDCTDPRPDAWPCETAFTQKGGDQP